MKNNNSIKQLAFIFIALLAFSCSEDIAPADVPENEIEGIVCTVQSMDFVEMPESRSSLTFDATKGMLFSWTSDDELSVFPTSGNTGIFHLKDGDAGKPTATFNGGGFTLTKDALYYVFSKSVNTVPTKEMTGTEPSLSAMTNLQVSYNGQKQNQNNNSDHLGRYDYMTALGIPTEMDKARLVFNHLGCNLFLDILIPDKAKDLVFESLELYEAGKNEFRQPVRSLNLLSGGSVPETYLPSWNDPDMSGNPARFLLRMGDSGFCSTNFSDGNRLKLFISVPAFDFTSKTLVGHFNLKDKASDAKDWFFTYTNKKLVPGKSYWIKAEARECTQYNINVQLVQDWQKGNMVEQSRATGDPGTTEKLDLPKYMYAYFINGGHVVQTATASEIEEADWIKAENRIFNYKGNWTFNVEVGKTAPSTFALDNTYSTNPKVYIVASKTALTLPTVTLGTSGTTEEIVKNFAYTYTVATSGTDSEKQAENQDFMKNLYSTPWADDGFTGELSSEYKDVRLYHVASKVDVNWENTTATALPGNVSVNNFPTTNLSFFKPTTANSTSGTATVSTPITTGTAYNGRAVFYLPQPSNATYNMTIGSGAAQDITFTPDPVFTSWFRGLVTIQ